MTVYVDDAAIAATVPNGRVRHTSRWSHLTADTQDELHAFAVGKLGLKRSYFQPGQAIGGKPSPFWHYDLTEGKRRQALALGAQPVPMRELPALCRQREARAAEHKPAAGQRPTAVPGEVVSEHRHQWASTPDRRVRRCGGCETDAERYCDEDGRWVTRYGPTLDRQCRERLIAAGITADDPGLQQIARHNAARHRAALGLDPDAQPEREAAR